MKKIIFAALAAVALLSCSKEHVLEQNRTNDEITFSVVADNQTKASNVFCNNNKPGSFTVSAFHDGKEYIKDDEITWNSSANKWESTNTRYWPNNGNVTFYAHVNAGAKYKNNATTPTIENFEVVTDISNQVDLMYAKKTQAKSLDGQVNLNFHHALSQIVFKAKNTNPTLYIEIEGVKVCNIGNVNTFSYPANDTDSKYGEHNGSNNIITYDNTWGTWKPLTIGDTDYEVSFAAVEVTSAGVDLTSANDSGKEYSSKAMLLLPQETTAWNPETNPVPDDSGNTGTYFLVKCLIYNIAGTTLDKTTDTCLWGKPDGTSYKAKYVAVPASFVWEQGKKYVYTFKFDTDGNGGYDPEPSDPSKPVKVLVPISYDVTIDEFIPVTESEIVM